MNLALLAKLRFAVALNAALIALTPLAQAAGGISEGGGDYRSSWFGAAWYLGQAPIKACVEIAPDFGLPLEKAKDDIRSAFATWARYMKAKKVHASVHNGDPNFRIISEVDLLSTCDGTQELTFFLGTNSAEITKVKEKFENPIGFIHRRNYDLAAARSNGFVWIAKTGGVLPQAGARGTPDWSMAYNFHGIVLHELGHLMGVPDIKGTVMDDTWLISRLQDFNDEFRRVSFTKIDYLHEIYSLPTAETNFNGFFGPWPCHGDVSACVPQYKAAFQILAGREPVGTIIKARFVGGNGAGSFLELTDGSGSLKLQLEEMTPKSVASFTLQQDIFKTYRALPAGTANMMGLHVSASGMSADQSGSVEHRTLVAPNGQRYVATIERNTSSPTALQVQVLLPKQGFIEIFTADTFQMPY